MKAAYIGIDLLYPVLQAMLEEDCEILEIFTCRTDNVTEFNTRIIKTAQQLGVPCKLERITAEDLKRLEAKGCELVVCAGYYYRTPVSDTLPMVNFHPSPLPVGRGSWPMPQILLRGLPCGGITAHKMARDFDTGEILLQETFPIRQGETLQSYMEQVYSRVPAMVHRLVHHLPEVLSQAREQGQGEYWAAPSESDWTVTPDMTAEEADHILRAFLGYECIYRQGESRTELIGGRAVAGDSAGQPFPLRDGYITAEKIRDL